MVPTDSRFPKMTVLVNILPGKLMNRLQKGDLTLESKLVVASNKVWRPESYLPLAFVKHNLGQGGRIKVQTVAFFEHTTHSAISPSEVLTCLAEVPWFN